MFKTLATMAIALIANAQFSVKITQEGEGDFPINGSKISAHYIGQLLDGTEFDSSVKRDRPFEFVLGQGRVIKCWDEGFA